MAKKEDNYSWLDKYSTDPRDLPFLDITQRHQDRQQRNTDRDAHDRENDEHNLIGSDSGTAGLYDELVFETARDRAAPAAPPPPPPSPPSPSPRRVAAPPPPPSAQASLSPPAPMPGAVQVAPAPQRRPDRLPSIQLPSLRPAPARQRQPGPAPASNTDTSLLDRLRAVPLGVFAPLIIGALILISSLSDGVDTPSTAPDAAPVPETGGTEISALVPGDCFLTPPSPGSPNVELWPCNEFHGGEVIDLVRGPIDAALEACSAIAQALPPEATAGLPDDAAVTLLLDEPDHRCVLISRSTAMIGSVVRPS